MTERGFKIIGLIAFAMLIAVLAITQNYKLKHNSKYTIGVTGEVFWTTMSGRQIDYVFKVKNKLYNSNTSYWKSVKVHGGRYYVQFNAKNPNNSTLLHNKPVPDSIKSAPPNGWTKIPGE